MCRKLIFGTFVMIVRTFILNFAKSFKIKNQQSYEYEGE